ncbi:hypothetical protein ABZ567_20720 [Streptomyces sp. NPDC016459]|uniref:hypothetical protein n=1 Tax=Streptomyces sp. NPDC016459 TaxID=3157190 RepID=UPI0033D6FDEC
MTKRNLMTTAVLAVGMALTAAVPAHAGIVDGTLNNADVLDNIALLNTAAISDSQKTENNNANTRADGKENNSTGQHT